ncbi:MAG: histidine kinase, partial [Bacteroidota bacterium]
MFKEYKLRGWSTFYFYVVILVCAACTSTCEHGEVIDSDVERQLDSLQASLRDLNVDEVKANHLVDLLRPVMLSSIEEFEVESWYINNKPDWLAEFGEQEIVHLCSEILFNKYLQQKDSVSAAKIMLNIGWLHFIDTNYAASIEAQKEALNLSDRADIVAWATNNIGAVLAQTNQLDAGKEYFDEVLSTPGVDSMPGVRAVSQMNLGIVHIVTGNLDTGLEFIEKAKLAVSGLGLTHIAEVVQLSHAFLLLNINEVDESIRLLEGMSGFNDGAVNRNNIFLNIYLSKAFLIKNDVDASSFYLDRACEMSEKLDLDFGRMTCWRLKMSLHERLEEYDNALNASQKYYDLRDEQEGSKTAREIQALEAKLIQDANEEIEEANRVLLASEERSKNLERQIISYSLFLFAALVLAFLFMRFKNKARLTAQRKSRAEAKLMLLQTQMSPHFLFNALGGIQNYILKSEKRVAYNYMGQFESMLRNLAESSGQVEVGLDEEIEFIRNYLELEKLRFRD